MIGWRNKYRVHPTADVLPMMSDEELAELGEDIKSNGLKEPITFDREGVLLDGRNRLEAMERAGIALRSCHKSVYLGDPAAYVISRNIRRRHLTKEERADLIVAVVKADETKTGEKLDHFEPVSVGGRSKVNEVKAKAVAIGKEQSISESTIKRSLAKAKGKHAGKKSSNSNKRHRRSGAEIKRDNFLEGFMSTVEALSMATVSDDALDQLTPQQRGEAIEMMESATRRLQDLVERLRLKDRAATGRVS